VSKKFKGKTCIYCGTAKSSQTGDHVFAREFFLPDRRDNIPQVPACIKCNNEKSILEHYLITILPFGGKHLDAYQNLAKMVPRRLEKNNKLHWQIAQNRENIWIEKNGIFLQSMKIPFDSSKLDKLFCFIVKGLMWHHWNILLSTDTFVRAGCIMEIAETAFQNFFNGNARQRVSVDLGVGTFKYEGVQGVDNPELSIWKFSIYGGLQLGDSPQAPSETPKLIWGLTGRNKIIPDFWVER
jgi:hypothetical protein